MEIKEEIKELKKILSKPFKPIENPIKNPIVQLIEFFKSSSKRKKLKEIEDLKLDIEKAILEKELKAI